MRRDSSHFLAFLKLAGILFQQTLYLQILTKMAQHVSKNMQMKLITIYIDLMVSYEIVYF
jgi:hypothetical protein